MNLTRNISGVFITNILVFLLAVPTSIIIARVLGPQGRGIYTLVILIPGLLYQLGNLGLGMANTYFIGRKRFNLTDITSTSLTFGLGVSVFLAILFLLAYEFFLHPFFKDVEPSLIYLVLLAMPFSIVPVYFRHILLAVFKIKEFNLLNILQPALMLIGVVLLLLLLSKGVFSLVLLSILVSGIMFLASFFLVKKLTKIKFRLKTNILKESLNYGIKVHLANMFSFLSYRLDMLLVGYFIGATQVGFYAIAVGIAEIVWFIPNAIQTILFPEVVSGEPSRSREITAKLCRHTLFFTFLACVGLVIIGKWAIEIVYGSAFFPSVMPLLILLPGVIALGLGKVMCAYLGGIGKPIFATYASLAALTVNIGLNLIFIPKWGIAGAALATSISYSLNSLIIFIALSKLSKVNLADILVIKIEDIRVLIETLKKMVQAKFTKSK